MRRPVVIVTAVVIAAALWQALASLLFLAVLGFWSIYPWPDRLWMWARYAVDAPPNAIVHRWLIITAVVASWPSLGVLFLVVCPGRLRSGPDIYGRTGWATPIDMKSGGIERARKP